MAVKQLGTKRNRHVAKVNSRNLLPALAVVGGACGLAATSVSALELGDIKVESTLGQPLRASIAYALNPNEQLYDFCIYLKPGNAGALVPTVSRARISITNGAIILTGNTPVRDPLLNVQVAIDCPYTPNLARQYSLIMDPILPEPGTRFAAGSSEQNTASQIAPTVATAPAGARQAPSPTNNVAKNSSNQASIPGNSEYRVRTGDSISGIASRIEGRTIGLWPAVNILVAANPDAFLENDASRLVAGSLLLIPDMSGQSAAANSPAARPLIDAPVPVASPVAESVAPSEPAVSAANALTEKSESRMAPLTEAADEVVKTTPTELLVSSERPAASNNIDEAPAEDVAGKIDSPMTGDETELRPGDIVFSSQPSAEQGSSTAAVPVVTVASKSSDTTSGWPSSLAWIVGGGTALLLGLFFFGRALRARFGSVAIGAAENPEVLHDEDPTQSNPAVNDVDFQFDAIESAELIPLDADLGAGTGLQDNAEMDVAQDFGFAAHSEVSSDLDFELTPEAVREPEESSTDIIAPSHRAEESSILDSESGSVDDYDLSMIVDATKQSIDEFDATAKNLQAVQIGSNDGDDEYILDDDTLNRHTDLDILAQDYEDELTATQAINKEIEKAAAELASRMEDQDAPLIAGTSEPLEPTVEMPNRATANGMTAELTEKTPTDIEAVNDDDAIDGDLEVTSKLAAAGSDITIEMQFESGKIDTSEKS
jgi:hypothetical protein